MIISTYAYATAPPDESVTPCSGSWRLFDKGKITLTDEILRTANGNDEPGPNEGEEQEMQRLLISAESAR